MSNMKQTLIYHEVYIMVIVIISPFQHLCRYELLQSRNAEFPTIQDTVNFFVGLITISSHNIKAMKKGSCSSPPEYILIGNPYQLVSKLCFCLMNSAMISFQYYIYSFLHFVEQSYNKIVVEMGQSWLVIVVFLIPSLGC